MKARSYAGLQDLNLMLDLLSAGNRANNGSHYIHRGDLQWWLFYNDDIAQVWKSNTRLWFDADRLIGWALISPAEQAVDIFTIPELHADPREHEMYAWAFDHTADLDSITVSWIADKDEARIRFLEDQGFARDDHHYVYFQRSLSDPLPDPVLPNGFYIRTARSDEADARLRAVASKAAFGSQKPFDEYWLRNWRFVQSPVYVPEHEIFVMSPDETVAAYCIVWTDPITKLGHFEPVGTHPDYQRKGLGKAMLFDAMIRLKSEGMTVADVCTNHDNAAAIHLYESVGFRITKKLLTYKKVMRTL
jgi:ribosomal protein S18 acetylase RimI-like enzyme